MQNTLILGIGNVLQSDDGVGVHVIRYIGEKYKNIPENIEIEDGGTAGFDLLPLFQNKKQIIIIDAILSDNSPGTVSHVKIDEISGFQSNVSLHQAGIGEVIRTLSLVDKVPEIDIIAISVDDITTFDLSVTQAVREAIPKAAELALELAGGDNYFT